MRCTFHGADFEALATLWNEFYPADFHLDAPTLRQNTVEQPLFDWGASFIQEIDGHPHAMLAVKRSANGLYTPADQDVYHVCALAFKEPDVAVDLLAEAKTVLRSRGATHLIFGQDAAHLFPGCPAEHKKLSAFLMVEGFLGDKQVVDLTRSVAEAAEPELSEGVEVRSLGLEDLPALEDFFRREFPKSRWEYDLLEKVRQEGNASCVVGLFLKGVLQGFALVQRPGVCKHAMGGLVWSGALGEKTAALGPIAIAEAHRGLGHGSRLVRSVLWNLREAGMERCLVDWVESPEFFEKQGFGPFRAYRQMTLGLEPEPTPEPEI